MSHEQLRNTIETIRSHIQAELEAQLSAVERQHSEAIETARLEARAQAEAHWKAEMNRVGADWESRLRAELAQAAAAAERRIVDEVTRVRVETEKKAKESIQQVRQEAAANLEQIRVEREQARVEGERARVEFDETLRSERSSNAAAQSAHAERVAQLERELEEARRAAETFENELASLRALHEQEAGSARELLEAESTRVRTLSTDLSDARSALDEAERRRQTLEEAERDRQALQEERRTLQEEIGAMRRSFDTERSAAQQALEAERAAARQGVDAQASQARDAADARVAERQSQLAATERLLGCIRAISEARSLSDVLAELVNGAAAEASRAVLLVPAGSELQGFKGSGFGLHQVRHSANGRQADVLQTALGERQAVPVTPANAPGFASLLDDRAGLAVPITVGGQAVAVLYADNGLAASPEVPASWPEAVEILCHHASAAVAHLTAVRTTQAMQLMRPASSIAPPQSGESGNDADQAARRYARLLVSEIKLYNEPAVRVGREKRDLLSRLRPEVERARRLYEERVPATVARRAHYFEQELRQTLADGDASLLGQAVSP